MDQQNENTGCNCNSRTPAADGQEFAEEFQGEICGCNHMMNKILEDKCNRPSDHMCPDMMDKILEEDCGCMNEYAADYDVDEYVADDVELAADNYLDNGDIIYRNTADYYMVTPENHCTSEDDIFDYQGS